jgi:hypothetical protein
MIKEPTDNFVAIIAVIAILILEIVALLKGTDGIMFGSAMTALGVIIGWVCKAGYSKLKKQ